MAHLYLIFTSFMALNDLWKPYDNLNVTTVVQLATENTVRQEEMLSWLKLQ